MSLSSYAAELLERYEQALETQRLALNVLENAKAISEFQKNDGMIAALAADPKLAQWKAETKARASEEYIACEEAVTDAEYEYNRAKIEVQVIAETLRTYRAERYGSGGDLPY